VLTNGYGVLAGTLTGHHRDTPDNVGKWFHVHLTVAANGHDHDCAIDVDSHQSNVGVEWRVVELRPSEWQAITALAPGFHLLASTSSSGALDYPRDQRLRQNIGCLFVMMPDAFTRILEAIAGALVNAWQKGSHVEATAALEGILEIGQPVYVFGEPFTTGFGVHNVHQNQGDPLDSQWAAENAIWQDGGTIVKRANGSMVAFISKFTSQSYKTDDQGHPLP
jgi:hypothetical protein